MTSVNYYSRLMSISYDEIIKILHKKYGKCKYDYFKKQSFENFIENKSKNINHNKKRSRYSEGLFLHHIDENIIENLSSLRVIKKNPSFIFQQRDHLVYCNYLEHLILHTTILKETNGKLSFKGCNTISAQLGGMWKEEKMEE